MVIALEKSQTFCLILFFVCWVNYFGTVKVGKRVFMKGKFSRI